MSDSTERWLPVMGYEGYYEVSDLGRVRSVERVVVFTDGRSKVARGRLLSPQLHPRHRRFYVDLWRDNAGTKFPVSRLVLAAFRGVPPAEASHGCHNNGDSRDDRLVNLRWDSQSANLFDAVRHGTHFHAKKTHCPRNHPLSGPNLIPRTTSSGRHCKACNRARADVQYAKRTRRPHDFGAWADDHYARIVQEVA
jgi:hypothetical protein